MQHFKEICLAAALAFLAACTSNQQVEDRLVAAFGETMFEVGNAAHSQGDLLSSDGTLARWQSPLTVAIVEGDTPANRKAATETLAELADLGGLKVDWVAADAADIKLKIHFSGEQDFVINNNQRTECYARVGGGEDGWLTAAEIHIATVKEGEWRTDCLTHEMLHALGWRGHTHRLRSAISYAHGETELTQWDRMMMRTLYDPRLTPGTAKADALPVARVILREMIEG